MDVFLKEGIEVFYLLDLYGFLNFLFNLIIWVLIIVCLIRAMKYLKNGFLKGVVGLFGFLKAKDILLRVKIFYITLGAIFIYVICPEFSRH